MIDKITAIKKISQEEQRNVRLMLEANLKELKIKQALKVETNLYESDDVEIFGRLRNLKVSLSNGNLKLDGSINKYFKDDNLRTMELPDIEYAIEEISSLIGTNFRTFKVCKLEVGFNFISMLNIDEIKALIVGCNIRRSTISSLQNGIYIRNSIKCLTFYDKLKEVKKVNVPNVFRGKNLVRVELRYKKAKTISRVLGNQPSTLDEVICNYDKIVRDFDEVTSSLIYETKLIEYIPYQKLGSKDLENIIYLNYMKCIGGKKKLYEMFDQLKPFFKYPNVLTNIKSKFESIESLDTIDVSYNQKHQLLSEVLKGRFNLYKLTN